MKSRQRFKQLVLQLLLVIFIRETLPDCVLPSKLDTVCVCVTDNYLQCSGLNSTTSLQLIPAGSVGSITKLEILNSNVDCLDFNHFTDFVGLTDLKVNYSDLKKLFCEGSNGQHHHESPLHHLKHLSSLDISHNKLTHLDSSLGLLSKLKHLNISHNKIRAIKPVFGSFKSLTSLDLSHNRLSDVLDRRVLEQLPSTLTSLHIQHNPWPCLPSLAWMYTWSLSLPIHIQVLFVCLKKLHNTYWPLYFTGVHVCRHVQDSELSESPTRSSVVSDAVLQAQGEPSLSQPLQLPLLPLRGQHHHQPHGHLHRHRQLQPGQPDQLPQPAQPDHGAGPEPQPADPGQLRHAGHCQAELSPDHQPQPGPQQDPVHWDQAAQTAAAQIIQS